MYVRRVPIPPSTKRRSLPISRPTIGSLDATAGQPSLSVLEFELAQWFGQETARVYRAMGESDAQRQRRELRQWIANRGGRVTIRDLQRNLRRYEHNADQGERDLNALVDEGLGVWEHLGKGKRGHPTEVFCLADSPDFSIRRSADADINAKNNGK